MSVTYTNMCDNVDYGKITEYASLNTDKKYEEESINTIVSLNKRVRDLIINPEE